MTDETEAESRDPEKATEKSGSRLTPAQWVAMAAAYELGETSMVDLSETYGVTVSAISQKFKRDGIQRGSKKGLLAAKVLEKTAEKISSSSSDFASMRKARVEETKNQSYEWITAIGKLTMKTLLDAQKKGAPFSTVQGDLKALRFASATIAQTRQERFHILDVENDVDEKGLPSIEIRDLTDTEISELRDSDADDLIEIAGFDEEEDDIIKEDGS